MIQIIKRKNGKIEIAKKYIHNEREYWMFFGWEKPEVLDNPEIVVEFDSIKELLENINDK